MIVGITSGKGGPGATVLAVHLAVELAARDQNCLLVDLDPWGGDVGAYLEPENLDPRRGLRPLLKLEHAPSPEAVVREAQPVSGVQVVLGLMRPEPELLAGRLPALLRAAGQVADVVIADLGRMIPTSPAREAICATDATVLAAHPDLQGALAAERAIAVTGTDPVVVATSAGRRQAPDVVELSEALKRPVIATFPRLRRPSSLGSTRRVRRCVDHICAGVPGLLESPAKSTGDGAQAVFAQ